MAARRRLISVFIGLALLMGGAAFWARLTVPSEATLPPLADGDLGFQTDRSVQMAAILFATGSLYTHVGVVEIDPAGRPFAQPSPG